MAREGQGYPCYQRDMMMIGLMGRVFAIGPGDWGSIPDRVIPKTLKMVLDTSLLNTQHYKVRINGKVEQSRGRSSEPFGSPSTTVASFTFIFISFGQKFQNYFHFAKKEREKSKISIHQFFCTHTHTHTHTYICECARVCVCVCG